MGGLSLIHWIIILFVVLLLFGGSRLSGVMSEAAKGIKAFREGLREDDKRETGAPPALPHGQGDAPVPGQGVSSERKIG